MTSTVGWIFFVAFWLMSLVAGLFAIAAIRLAVALNQARGLLEKVEHNTTGEVHGLILEYLARTKS